MKSIHILMVEDNDGDILLTSEALDEAQIHAKLSIAKDGKEAMDFLNKEGKYHDAESPGMVLLDINLPKRSGHEVLQFIKGNEKLRHIPVIMLSTSSFEKDINLAYKNKASGYITKPVEVNELIDVIARIERTTDFYFKLPAEKHLNGKR